MSRTLSAPVALPCRCDREYTGRHRSAPGGAAEPSDSPAKQALRAVGCHCGAMLLRLLREPRTGRPAPAARLVALVLAVGMLLAAGPVLLPLTRWVLSLL